jgi:hypothetical protein
MKKDFTLILLLISLALVLVAVTFTASAQSQERSAGNPIGGIIVKEGHNGVAAANVQAANPLHVSPGTVAQNPLFKRRSTGSSIGAIVVKGGQNPRPALLVIMPENSKSINEKGVKRN